LAFGRSQKSRRAPVLQDNSDTIGQIGQLSQEALLKEAKSTNATRLTRLQNDDRSSRLIVRGIEPVAEVERGIGVRLVLAFVLEMVH